MLTSLLIALLLTAEAHPLLQFTLQEGGPGLIARFHKQPVTVYGKTFTVLNFPDASGGCDGHYAYSAYLNQQGEILSILHQPDARLLTSEVFPEKSYRQVEKPGGFGSPLYFLIRDLGDGRVLIASAPTAKPKYLDQVLLIRRSDVGRAFPALAVDFD